MHTLLMALGYIRNTNMDGVVRGKFSAQVPGRNGVLPERGAGEDVTVILLGARSNQFVSFFFFFLLYYSPCSRCGLSN